MTRPIITNESYNVPRYVALYLQLFATFHFPGNVHANLEGFPTVRFFPAGVRPGWPSRDAANWRSSRFSRSIETRRRSGWLTIVLPGARLFRAPIWCPSGSGGTREAWSTVAESLVAFYQVGTQQIRRGWRAARSSTSQESAESLCTKIKGANREVSEGKADL